MNKTSKVNRTVEEDPGEVGTFLKILRELLSADKSLYAPNDDTFLLMFLRSMEFDCQGTFRLIQKYYQFRIDYPQIFLKVCPSELMGAFEGNMLNILPKRDQHGRRIIIFKCGAWEPSQVTTSECVRAMHFCLETTIQDEEAQKNGIIVVADWKEFSWKQAQHIRPNICIMSLRILMEGAPVRYHAFHVINQSILFEIIYHIFNRFLNEEVRKKIFRHGNDWSSLHKHIDPSILPVEYGGSWVSEDSGHEEFIQKLLACNNYFIEQSKYGYTSKR